MSTETTPLIIIIGAGQSGLAAARCAHEHGLQPLILEAADNPTGSWPHYYDSLTLFSPARYSSMPDLPFPGDPDHYPHKDEVVAYLERYAQLLNVEIRTNTRVSEVSIDGPGFVVQTTAGDRLPAAGVVVASGSFGNPHRPRLPGAEGFAGGITHVADYRNAAPYAGQRIVVVGAGNSAIQVAHELAERATVTLARLREPAFVPQVVRGHDVHYWFDVTGFDHIPGTWLQLLAGPPLVLDTGDYHNAYRTGRIDQRPMFTELTDKEVVWADGEREVVDALILATGYRPNVGFLQPLGALDGRGLPLQVGGISTTHPGLVYLGLEGQRSFHSNTLRGVSRDAEHVMAALTAYTSGALQGTRHLMPEPELPTDGLDEAWLTLVSGGRGGRGRNRRPSSGAPAPTGPTSPTINNVVRLASTCGARHTEEPLGGPLERR